MVELQRHESSITDAANIGSLSEMLYMGAASVQVENESVVNSNKSMVQAMSQPIALVNKEFFKQKLMDKLDSELHQYINSVNTRKGEKPIVDNYGRVTYYYAQLGDKRVPVYQPGTIMFECGVVNDSDLAVEAHGSQQNGAILGNGCALFLCKFMARLIQCYEATAEDNEVDQAGPVHQECYKMSLTKTLQQCCLEDVKEHGRLLALKDILASLTEKKALDEEQLVCLYVKDISIVRGTTCEEDTLNEILENVPDSAEVEQIIEKREAESKFRNDQMFREGSVEISEELEKIRDAILCKDGIVSVEKQDLFREQLHRTFSNDLIKAMAKAPQKTVSAKRLATQSTVSIASTADEDEDDASNTEDDTDAADDEEEKKDDDEDDGGNEEDGEEVQADDDDDLDQIEISRNWIKALGCNYPLKTYYKHMKKNLLIVLGSERIHSKHYPKWSENLFHTFCKVKRLVPEMQYLFQDLGLDESQIMQSAAALQDGLLQAQKYRLARYISQYLVIVQRTYLSEQFNKDDFSGLDLDHIKTIFDSTNMYEVRADLDAFSIMAQIAAENNPMMLEMADPMKGTNGVHALGDHLIGKFQNELRQKRYSAFETEPIQPDEMPQEIMNLDKLILPPHYFVRNDMGFRLPRVMKRVKADSDVIYETRIKNYLLNMDDNQFMQVADIIDPDDAQQYAFFELYNEISSERNQKPEGSSKCSIF